MAKKADAEALKALPKLGCSLCIDGEGEGFAGYIYVQIPGGARGVKHCECYINRAQAKKALEAKA